MLATDARSSTGMTASISPLAYRFSEVWTPAGNGLP